MRDYRSCGAGPDGPQDPLLQFADALLVIKPRLGQYVLDCPCWVASAARITQPSWVCTVSGPLRGPGRPYPRDLFMTDSLHGPQDFKIQYSWCVGTI